MNGFPVTGRPTMRTAVLVTVAGALVAACGSGGGASPMPAGGSTDIAVESMSEPDSGVVREQVIQTANVTIEVDSIDTALTSIAEQVRAGAGFVQSRSVNRYDGDATANLIIRIPASNLDGFLESLAAYGEVLTTTVEAQDVTLEVIDLDARLATLDASIDRLRQLQGQATTIADLVAVESELANRQSEYESLAARRDFLADQVEMSTIYLWLEQRDSGAAIAPDFPGGLQRGWDALLTLGAGVVTAAGFLLPTAITVLIVVTLVVGIIRVIRKRAKRKEKP